MTAFSSARSRMFRVMPSKNEGPSASGSSVGVEKLNSS